MTTTVATRASSAAGRAVRQDPLPVIVAVGTVVLLTALLLKSRLAILTNLVLSVMIVLLYQGLFPWWAVCVVAIRELAVDGLRLVAVEQGLVIPAGKLGKFKTNAQIFSVLAALLFLPGWLVMALAVIMSVLTVISGIQYFYGARSVFQMEETERKI